VTAAAFALEGPASLSLGGRDVLHEVAFEAPAGRFIGLLGANGAGKTTLMRSLLGLVPPRTGRVSVFGAPARRGNRLIGYLPQSRGLPPPSLSGRALVAAALEGQHWGLPRLGAASRAGSRREVERVLALVDATNLADRPLGQLSGGERQRLLLAQALLGSPRLLLLDEPLVSLDPSRAVQVVSLVRRLQRVLGISVLFSAHEINPLLGALDEVLVLAKGQARIGPVDTIMTGPVLSELYGSPIEVVRVGGRLVVVADPPAEMAGPLRTVLNGTDLIDPGLNGMDLAQRARRTA